MHIRLLTRRSGLRAHSYFNEPLLEIAEVFRFDAVRDAFELPDFEGHVRFVFTQGDDWRPPTPPGEEEFEIPDWMFDVASETSTVYTQPDPPLKVCDANRLLYHTVFGQDPEITRSAIHELAHSTLVYLWVDIGGDLTAQLFTEHDLEALRARYWAQDPLEREIVYDIYNLLDSRDQLVAAVQLFAFIDDHVAAMRHCATNIIR